MIDLGRYHNVLGVNNGFIYFSEFSDLVRNNLNTKE
jgi:hypothetical protein